MQVSYVNISLGEVRLLHSNDVTILTTKTHFLADCVENSRVAQQKKSHRSVLTCNEHWSGGLHVLWLIAHKHAKVSLCLEIWFARWNSHSKTLFIFNDGQRLFNYRIVICRKYSCSEEKFPLRHVALKNIDRSSSMQEVTALAMPSKNRRMCLRQRKIPIQIFLCAFCAIGIVVRGIECASDAWPNPNICLIA